MSSSSLFPLLSLSPHFPFPAFSERPAHDIFKRMKTLEEEKHLLVLALRHKWHPLPYIVHFF
jgi:hypothetical protein